MRTSGSVWWVLGGCICALLACKQSSTAFGKAFVRGCDETCQTSGGDGSCGNWCQCTYDQAVTEQGGAKQADAWLMENAKSGTWSPELSKVAGEAITRCSPGLYEKKTLYTCKRECGADAKCQETCGCFLEQLMKIKPTKDESIIFLIVNVDMSDSPEGKAAVERAVRACTG